MSASVGADVRFVPAAAGLARRSKESQVNPPKVSVIINNYNYGAYLASAISSALAQDLQDLEVIVVDDGSTDDSRDVLRQFAGKIRVVEQDNHGQAAAINAGFHESRGEILCFLDADDWWAPGKLSAVVAAFDRDPRVALVYHRLQMADREGRALPSRPIPRGLCTGRLEPRLVRSAGWWPFPMTSAVAVRRSVWRKAGDIPETFRISADAWLVGIYPFLGRVFALPAALGFYRIHGDNNWTRPVDAAMLRRRIAHFETTVDVTNQFLREQGLPYRLTITDHLPRRIARAQLVGGTLSERIGIAAETLVFPGEPNPLRRIRDAVRAARMLRDKGLEIQTTANASPKIAADGDPERDAYSLASDRSCVADNAGMRADEAMRA